MNESLNNSMLDALTLRGLLLSVSVRYWRARKKLRPEDLGIAPDAIDERLFSLGHKKLLPKEALQRFALIESRAHAMVEAATFPFLGGVARYLPNPKLENTYAGLHGLQNEFELCRDEFLGRYGKMRERALSDWREAAVRLGVDTDRMLAVIDDAFPSHDKVARHFAFDIRTFQIAMPEAVPTARLVELGAQREIVEARRQAVLAARGEIDASCREFIADCTATLREQTAKLCAEMLTTIRTTGNVHQKTLNRLVKFIDDFKQLNFAGDLEMESQLDRVRSELLNRSAEDYRQNPAATRSLEAGLSQLRDQARELAGQDARELVERFGQMGRRKLQLAS